MASDMINTMQQAPARPRSGRVQRPETLGELAVGIAHDFNNQLAIILGNAELLAEDIPGDSALLPMIDLIRAAAERGEELAGRLQLAAEPELPGTPADPATAVERVNGVLRNALAGRFEISLEFADGLDRIDARQLESALLHCCTGISAAVAESGRLALRIAYEGERPDAAGR